MPLLSDTNAVLPGSGAVATGADSPSISAVSPTSGVTADTPISVTNASAPALGDLYPSVPYTTQAKPAERVTATEAPVTEAVASEVSTPGVADATQAVMTDEMSAASQLADITSQDSPLMARARQSGMLTAAKRGLQNSSIAAAASEGAMVDRATPLAQQDAATAARIEELNAKLGTDVSKFNADQLNEAERLTAKLETAVSQSNAAEYNIAKRQLADLQTKADLQESDNNFKAGLQYSIDRNAMVTSTQQQITEMNKQFMAGTQAIDIADINGRYNTLISQSESAGKLFDSFLSGISGIMSNENIDPARVTEYIKTQTKQLEGGLQFMQDMTAVDMGDFTINPSGGYTSPGTTTPGSVYVPPAINTNAGYNYNLPTAGARTTTGKTYDPKDYVTDYR